MKWMIVAGLLAAAPLRAEEPALPAAGGARMRVAQGETTVKDEAKTAESKTNGALRDARDDTASGAKKVESDTNTGLAKTRVKARKGAKNAEAKTNSALQDARENGKSGAKQAEDKANDALHEFRKKVGTEK